MAAPLNEALCPHRPYPQVTARSSGPLLRLLIVSVLFSNSGYSYGPRILGLSFLAWINVAQQPIPQLAPCGELGQRGGFSTPGDVDLWLRHAAVPYGHGQQHSCA